MTEVQKINEFLDSFNHKLNFMIERIELLRRHNDLKSEINGFDHLVSEHNYVSKFSGLAEQRDKIEKQLRKIEKELKINCNKLKGKNT